MFYNQCNIASYMVTGVKITVGHRPFAGQISNVAAHFLVCLTNFRSNKARR